MVKLAADTSLHGLFRLNWLLAGLYDGRNLMRNLMRLVCVLIFGGFLVLHLAEPVLGQRQPRFRVASDLILVDVRVRDSDNRPITGLRAEDFLILEEGTVQEISFFQEIALPLTSSRLYEVRTETNAVPIQASSDSPQPMAWEKRLLILLFNFSTAGLQDIQMMQEAAQEFLEKQFTSDDAAAVLVFNKGLEMLTDFTSDQAILSQALARLQGSNPELEVSLPEEDLESDDSLDSEFVADETEFALFETNQQLSAIQSVADAFREVLGRKALIYFSAGLSSRGIENDQQMRWTTDLCNRANMSIYSVDARGLVALSPGGGAHRSGRSGLGIFNGRASLNQLVSLTQSQEGLTTLAADTGGVALIDDNDLSKIFRRAREDASHYYLIGYQTPTQPNDGRFRRIEVRCKISYAKLEYRRGYYTDKPYKSLSTSEKEFKLLQTIVEDLPVWDFPLEIGAEYFPDSSGQYQVPILLAFNYSQMSKLLGAKDLNLELILLARDIQKVTRAGVRDNVQIRRRGGDAEVRFVYQNLLVLEAGQYQLAAYVRDNRSGMMSQALHDLDLPPFGPVQLSSLVLAGAWKEPDSHSGYRIKKGKHVTTLQNPLQVRDRVLIPRVDSNFKQQETLYLHGKIGIEEESQSGDYRIILLDENQERLFESEWKTLMSGNKRPLDVNARFPLNQLELGKYKLVVEVRLKDSSQTHTMVRDFNVTPF